MEIKAQANNPKRAGQRASRLVIFGDHGRYAVAAMHTRFDAVEWFVWDAEHPNATMHRSEVIRQEQTLEKALAGLMETAE